SQSSLTRFVHNGYLYLAVKLGLVAFVSFLIFCATLLVDGIRIYLRLPGGVERLTALAAVCSFAGLLEWGWFEPQFMLSAGMAAVGLMVGLVLGAEPIRAVIRGGSKGQSVRAAVSTS